MSDGSEDGYKIKTGIHTGGTLPPFTEEDAAEVASILDGIIARRARKQQPPERGAH